MGHIHSPANYVGTSTKLFKNTGLKTAFRTNSLIKYILHTVSVSKDHENKEFTNFDV
jgi:hypothetical protein